MASSINPTARKLLASAAPALAIALGADDEAALDPLVVARKGQLVALVAPQAGAPEAEIATALAELRRRYYADPSLDVIPTLCHVLPEMHAAHPALRQAVPLVAVLIEMEVLAVGTLETAAWLLHLDESRQIMGAQRPIATPAGACEPPGYQSVRWRLVTGDALVLSVRLLSEQVPPQRLGRLARQGAADRAAATLSRSGAARGGDRPPVLLVRAPGYGAVAAFSGLSAQAPPPVEAPRVRAPGERSPIWAALLIAAVAIALAVWIKRPALTAENLAHLVDWALTPLPSATPAADAGPATVAAQAVAAQAVAAQAVAAQTAGAQAIADATQAAHRITPTEIPAAAATHTPRPTATHRPTATPTPRPKSYALPRLLSPVEGETVYRPYLVLDWSWEGELDEDEYFDVRLWQHGTSKRGIAWTKNTEYIERWTGKGPHSWTVVVIRGRDGVVVADLSAEPRPVNFSWESAGSSGGNGSGTDEPAYPTRQVPPGPPTRTSPGDEPGG